MRLLRHLFESLATIAGILVIVFFLMHLTGDPVRVLLPPTADAQTILNLKRRLGLDQPLLIQLGLFFAQAVRGDFGDSFVHSRPAMQVIMESMGASLQLAAVGFVILVGVGVPLGVIAATHPRSLADRAILVFSMIGQSVPLFWLGTMLIFVFSVNLRLLPSGGYSDAKSLILPGVTLGAYSLAVIARVTRTSLLEELGKDYARTARAKGLGERIVIFRHALRNAAIPVVTLIGLQVPVLIGGAVIIEPVFAYPGVARKATQAIFNRDIAVVMAFVTVMAVIVVVSNLMVDLLYEHIDPRIRKS